MRITDCPELEPVIGDRQIEAGRQVIFGGTFRADNFAICIGEFRPQAQSRRVASDRLLQSNRLIRQIGRDARTAQRNIGHRLQPD